MEPAAKQIESKATRYLIGASILLLALMLFSELSCSLLGLCSNWFPLAEIIGFWEVLGIATALLFTAFSIRALRRTRQPQFTTHLDSPSQSFRSPHSLIKSNREGLQQNSNHSDYSTTEAPAEPCSSASPNRSSGWRDLFNQLSDEEKQKLKTIMEKHCIPPPEHISKQKQTSDSSQSLRS